MKRSWSHQAHRVISAFSSGGRSPREGLIDRELEAIGRLLGRPHFFCPLLHESARLLSAFRLKLTVATQAEGYEAIPRPAQISTSASLRWV